MKYTFPIVLIAAFGLAGCAAVVKPMTSPNGYQGYHITCSGSADDWTSCYEAATKECQGPYRIIDRMGSNTFTPYGPYITRELIVECPAWVSPKTRKPTG